MAVHGKRSSAFSGAPENGVKTCIPFFETTDAGKDPVSQADDLDLPKGLSVPITTSKPDRTEHKFRPYNPPQPPCACDQDSSVEETEWTRFVAGNRGGPAPRAN